MELLDDLLPCMPPHLLCPITQMPMVDPVDTADRQTYERFAITQWLETHDTSPLTGLKLMSQRFTPNVAIREEVAQELRAALACDTPLAGPKMAWS